MNYEDLIDCIIEQGSDPCLIETEEAHAPVGGRLLAPGAE